MRVFVHAGPIEVLADAWRALHAGQPFATPFSSYEWASAWWRHYAQGGEPWVVVVEEGQETIGLAPLIRRRRGPVRVLEPIGIEPGDYWDLLAAPGRHADVSAAVAAFLQARGRGWDGWILRFVPPDSSLEAAVGATAPVVVWPRVPAPVIVLPDSFDAYLAGLSSSRRQNLRRHLRRLDGGEVELRPVEDLAQLPASMRRWQDFRRRQWEAAGRAINPVHLTATFAAFVGAAVAALLPAGQAQVWEFASDGDVIGTYVNFCSGRAYHWYLGGFDPAHARLGLGKIAIGHGIRTSIEAGRRTYDLGRGAEPYKYWYGAVDQPLVSQVVGNRRPRSRAVLAAVSVLRAARD